MTTLRPLAVMALSLFLVTSRATAEPESGVAYHIVAARHAIGAGERVQLEVKPPPPAGTRVTWSFGAGPPTGRSGGTGYRTTYFAPLVIASDMATIRVRASLTDLRISVSTELRLIPGQVPGVEDCLAAGQSFSPSTVGIEPSPPLPDELPELIHRVDPQIPRSAQVREVQQAIRFRVLVCRTGRVIAAIPLLGPPRGEDDPIDVDPRLVEAAVAAVLQYQFKPAILAGQPIAVEVFTPVRFAP